MTNTPNSEQMLREVQTCLEDLVAARAAMPPRLDFATIPAAEKDAASSVELCLLNLEHFVRSFQSAASLFDYSFRRLREGIQGPDGLVLPEPRCDYQSRGWMGIAGRDGAMSIYHFGVTAAGVRSGLGLCRSVGARIDHKELRAALREFEQGFPAYVAMRDAVAHSADRLLSPSKLREHTPANNVVIADGFIGSTFTTTWEGKALSYDLSQPSLNKLESTRRRIWNLFR